MICVNDELTCAEKAAHRMRAIAAELASAGLDTQLHEGRGGIDVTAATQPPGQREIEAIIDEDDYCELRFWTPPGTQPAEVAAIITRAVAAITAVTALRA